MRVITLIMCAALLAACGQRPAEEKAAPPAPETNATWDARLIELMPYIDACIEQSPETRWVSFAGGANDRATIVRLVGDGGGFDCVTPAGSSPMAAGIRPRNESLDIEGENAAIFVRGPGENPGGECYEAPEVRAPDGTLLGWMADPEGC